MKKSNELWNEASMSLSKNELEDLTYNIGFFLAHFGLMFGSSEILDYWSNNSKESGTPRMWIEFSEIMYSLWGERLEHDEKLLKIGK